MGLTPFQLEAWIEYAIGISILCGRIIYRARLVRWNWNGDDYFAVAAVVFLTGETSMLQVIGEWGSIVGMTDEKALSLTEAEKENIVKGAKADMAGWCLYITLIWCLKACMLFFYRRLALGTTQKRLVVVGGIAWVCSYLATIGVVLLRCLPLRRNWQIYPYPGDECGKPDQIFLTLVVTNVTTDLLILYIPLPLLWVVKIPLGKKIIYSLWLTTGIFVIVASLLRCVLSIRYANQVDVSTIWAIRETFVGIICVNAPVIGPPLVKKGTSLLSSITSSFSQRCPEEDAASLGHPTIITIGRRSTHPNRFKRDGHHDDAATRWTTINASDEYVLMDYGDGDRPKGDDGAENGRAAAGRG